MTDFKALAKAVRDEETFPGDATIELLAAVEAHECDPSAPGGPWVHEDDIAKVEAQRAALAKELAELRGWPCEGRDCEHTLADIEAHDANHPKPTSGGCWFCLACWNKAVEAGWEAHTDVMAERDKLAAENAALVAKVTKLREAIEKIMREEDAANLSKYDCPSSQLRWAIEEAEELLKEAEGAP